MARAEGVVFCGGGTGGHVFPGLAVAAACRAIDCGPLRWVGDPERLEAELVPRHDIPLLPYGLSRPRPSNPRWLWQALKRAWACAAAMRRDPPRVVVALGGYAALLPGLLAPVLRRRLVVLEQNAHPGRTNRLLARFADHVVTQFPEAGQGLPQPKIRPIGNPVRRLAVHERGKAEQLRVLVMGGSLAATSINELFTEAAPELAAIAQLHIVHLAGREQAEEMRAVYHEHGVSAEVQGFCDDMPALYDRVDLAVCRAGATTVAECCAAGLGALYIPLPWAAEDHQTANARAVARVGGAAVLPQAELTAAGLVRVLRRLVGDRKAVTRLGRAARRLARPDAALQTAALLQAQIRREEASVSERPVARGSVSGDHGPQARRKRWRSQRKPTKAASRAFARRPGDPKGQRPFEERAP